MHFWAFQKKEKTAKAEKINHFFFNNGWGFFIILWVCSFNFLFKINFSPFERTERVRSLLMHFLEKGLSEMRLKIHSFLAREIQSNWIRNAKLWPNKMKAFFFLCQSKSSFIQAWDSILHCWSLAGKINTTQKWFLHASFCATIQFRFTG